MPQTRQQRDRLIEIVRRRSYGTGVQIRLASGRTSDFYFNMKPTMMDPEGSHLLARQVLATISDLKADLIGGLEMGAVPLAAAVAAVSHADGTPLPAFFVRKQAKEHGTRSMIEGLVKGETLAGRSVVVVEDVTTTGGSALKAIEAIRAEGGKVLCVVTAVDREEGAADNFRAAGVDFRPVLRVSDFR